MRSSRLLIAACAGLCAATAIAQPMGMPSRRAGLWQTTVSGMGGGGHSMTMSACVDPATEHGFSSFAGPMGGHSGPGGPHASACSKEDAHKIPGGWAFESVCTRGGQTHTTSGTVTGDFSSRVHVEINTNDGGPERHMTVDAAWVGPCPPGGGGNTVTLPDGRVIQIPPH